MPQTSKRGQSVIASPIRKFLPLVRQAEDRGVTFFKLNTGDPDIPAPTLFFDTLKKYKKKNLGYAPSPGDPGHVEAWVEYYRQFGVRLRAEHIIPTVGCAEAILLALMAVADVGDEIIVFEPLYVSYKSFAVMLGIRLVPVTLRLENNFSLPAIKEIEQKITAKTKAIVIINPDNPTGKIWADKELTSILRLARKHRICVLSDETYREIRFTGRPSCLLTHPLAGDAVVVVDSVSKRYSMPGARVGTVVSRNTDIMSAVLKFAQARLSVGTLEQFALIPLLKNSKKITTPVKREYLRRRQVVYRALSRIPGVECSKPDGAFYIMAQLPVDSAENFVRFMIEKFSYQGKSVLVSPMHDFYITAGERGKNEIRIAYVLNVRELKGAMEVLARGLAAYHA